MKKFCVALSFMLLMSGCSIYKAATAPEPIQLDRVKAGVNRSVIIGTLGVPKVTETKADAKTDIHEFVNGSPSATKARIVLYIAGDVFTLSLTELVFWPMELGFGQGTEGRAIVTYGMDDIAKTVLLTKKDGSPWDFAPQAANATDLATAPN